MERPKKIIILIMVGIGIFIGIWMFLAAVRTIEPGEKGVLVTWGEVDMSQVYGEGLHYVNPFGGQTLIPINVQTLLASEKASAASKDLQDVSTNIGINFKLDGTTVNKLYRDIGLGYVAKLIQPFAQEAIKQVTAQYNAGQLITQRETIKQKIQDVLTTKLRQYGIDVQQVSITDFDFSPQFRAAIEQKVTANQVQEKEEINFRIKQVQARQVVATAQGQRNSTIAIAEGEKQSAILKAEGQGQAIALVSQGQAKAIKLVNDALINAPQYLQYQKVNNWDGQLPKVTGSEGGNIILLPSDILAKNPPRPNATR